MKCAITPNTVVGEKLVSSQARQSTRLQLEMIRAREASARVRVHGAGPRGRGDVHVAKRRPVLCAVRRHHRPTPADERYRIERAISLFPASPEVLAEAYARVVSRYRGPLANGSSLAVIPAKEEVDVHLEKKWLAPPANSSIQLSGFNIDDIGTPCEPVATRRRSSDSLERDAP